MGRILGSLYRFQDYIDIDTGRTQYPLLFCCVCLKQGGLCAVLHKPHPLAPSEPRQKRSAAAKEHVLVSAVVQNVPLSVSLPNWKEWFFLNRVSVSVSVIISYFLLFSLIAQCC